MVATSLEWPQGGDGLWQEYSAPRLPLSTPKGNALRIGSGDRTKRGKEIKGQLPD